VNFLYPLGLIGLIGVPILILIYIIKSKYAEQTVASTYLWELSERFLKRKRPISPLTGIIGLILQLISVIAVSLIVAHPIITVPNSANEYCFVLDSSGSMGITEGDSTRFDEAKKEILKIVDESTDGSIYTLITVGNVTAKIADRIDSKKQLREYVSELECGYAEADLESAMRMLSEIFDSNPSVINYLLTDTDFEKLSNVELINVARGAKNAAIGDVVWDISGGTLTVRGNVSFYGGLSETELSLYADGGEESIASCSAVADEDGVFAFELKAPMKTFSSLKLKISEGDGMPLDDEYVIYDSKSEDTYSALIVSETPFFIETVLRALGHTKLTVMTPDEYSSEARGYGLYVFDSCTPSEMPEDGAVWFLDPQGSVPESGFSVQGDVTLSTGDTLSLTESTSTVAAGLTEGIRGEGIEIVEYVRCSLYRSFTTVFSYKGNPIIFAGTNAKGHREVVFAFDIHNSNLPVLVDYIVLMENLMSFSFPDVVEKTAYAVGDEASVNVVAGCDSIRVDSPLGNVTYLGTETAVSDFTLNEVGTYKITVTVSRIPREFYIYSSLPERESDTAPEARSFGPVGQSTEGGFDGTFDPIYILFIILALAFLSDWGLYCYEKYQLR
jgi:hypothetical protein